MGTRVAKRPGFPAYMLPEVLAELSHLAAKAERGEKITLTRIEMAIRNAQEPATLAAWALVALYDLAGLDAVTLHEHVGAMRSVQPARRRLKVVVEDTGDRQSPPLF